MLIRPAPIKPQTLADRAKAYGELILAELSESKTLWYKRTRLQAIGAGGLGMFVILAGMGAMLWAVTPAAQTQTLWVLAAVPLAFLFVGIACLVAAGQQKSPIVLEHTRERFMADVAEFKKTNLVTVATERFVVPIATVYPYRLVIGAALVGALVVRAHPWRLLSGSALLVSLLPKVISVLSKQATTLR